MKKKEPELTRTQKLKLKAKQSALRFKKELKKSTITAIVSAFGFLIALVWRDVITEWVTKISETSPIKGSLITAGIVTLISVVGIVLISSWDNVPKE